MTRNWTFTTAFLAGLTLTAPAWASKDQLSKMVPGSKVVVEDGSEFEVVTAKNTAIEIDFNRDGTLDEASGNAAEGGDVFQPGNNLLSLESAVAALKKAGKKPLGEWSLDKSLTNGWVYEFEGVDGDKKMKYILSAADGKFIKERRDW